MDKLRWGILGTGNIARQFAAGLRASQRGELISVASRARETGHAFAMEYRARTLWLGYENLVKDPDVDAVYVSLPNSMHHEWTIAALKAGKHVLCEKPLATNAREAEEMFDVAQRCGKVLIEAFMYRSHPLTLAVVDAVKSGAIGELKLIRTSFCFRTRSIEGNIRFNSDLAGGSLMDVGCYCINFSRLFAGSEPEKIHATGILHSSGVDEYAAATLTFPNGIVASMVCGMTVQADNSAYLCGSDGYIEIPIPWKPPSGEAIFVVSGSVPPRMERPEAGGKPPAPGSAPRDVRRVPSPGELYGFEADDFAAAALDGRPPRLSRADSVGNMRVLDEMRRQIGVKF
ncbi:MAG TPA: Gfo/Idh/MocA family oxidoreductase [Tepidisphaeraceae bacterium]|nr:Gfo/Idh/MocA family oxidoreductase [Tepidisphaeraceae bacterium]